MERHEAEAIYDAGRERCVDFILALGARYERLEARVERIDVRPRHPKVSDATDPLHHARKAEVTSLWRLAAR